jgi:hypothetical protein
MIRFPVPPFRAIADMLHEMLVFSQQFITIFLQLLLYSMYAEMSGINKKAKQV